MENIDFPSVILLFATKLRNVHFIVFLARNRIPLCVANLLLLMNVRSVYCQMPGWHYTHVHISQIIICLAAEPARICGRSFSKQQEATIEEPVVCKEPNKMLRRTKKCVRNILLGLRGQAAGDPVLVSICIKVGVLKCHELRHIELPYALGDQQMTTKGLRLWSAGQPRVHVCPKTGKSNSILEPATKLILLSKFPNWVLR